MITINGATIAANPVLPPWTGLAPWIVSAVLVALLIWAIVEVIRNDTFSLVLKVAFVLLALVVPFIGPIITIGVARSDSRRPRQLAT